MFKLHIIINFLLISCLFAGPPEANDYVNRAWQSWQENDQQAVEENSHAALRQDSTNARAYLGLTFLYSMQENDSAAWQSFRRALGAVDNPYPYIFASWSLVSLLNDQDTREPEVIELWKKLTTEADEEGILKAMANQFLGGYYERRNALDTSRAYYGDVNAVKSWTVIGPFDNISASGFDKVFPPEREYKFDKVYEGKNGIPARWFNISEVRPDYWIDFRRYFAHDQAVFYGNNFVYSPRKQTVQLRIGTSGSLKAFLNDELMVKYFDENNNDLDTYIVETELQQGWNRLLIKVGFSEIDQCNFMVRLTDARGAPVKGLIISTDREKYPHQPGAPAKILPNFAEEYFKERINRNPGFPENYILLAASYLRNDKAIEGELILKEAIQRFPGCALFYQQIVEAYGRGEKFDEVATVMEKIYSLDRRIPAVLDYKFNRYLENGQFENAAEMLERLAEVKPESEELYQNYLNFYSQKKQIEKVIETAQEGYEKFQNNWQFILMQANISIQSTRSYGQAIEILQKYLDGQYTAQAIGALAEMYLKASAIDLWELTYKKLFELDPSGAGYYFDMADTYVSLRKYPEAEKMIRKAIDICPNSSQYWTKLGEIYRASDSREKAQEAYRQSLKYNPANYEARDKLRELEGKKSIFAQFESVDIDSVIRTAPSAESYPEDGALILFHDARRVVYEQGTSEMAEELLIKVFNNRGIDEFKEYWISHNSYTEDLTVEKAVVIKKDGSEINADVSGNHLVFKALEANDIIHLRWKIRNYYNGKLSNQFWDQFYFNGFYPIKEIRYSLLAPQDFDFNHNTQDMPDEPSTKKTEDGIIYRWRLTDEPAISYEYGMPILDDIGKILYISSIGNWGYMVKWYTDLAQTKTRSSYEIREQVASLFKNKPNAGEKEKITTIYNFITENIRYSSVSFRQSGLIPQEARDVLVTKIGDCKDVATLCIAMLDEVGIDAHYVLVNTKDEGSNKNALPSIVFNHCITAVETRNGIQYLDLTANNYPYGSVPEMDIDGFALMIKPGVEKPFYLKREYFKPSNLLRGMKVGVREDNSVVMEKDGIRTGSLAAAMRNLYREQPQSAREKHLTETLASDYPGVKLLSFDLLNLEDLNEPLRYSYQYSVPDYVSEVSNFRFLKIPWTDDLEINKALSYEKRKYPYYYWPGVDTLRETAEIIMPACGYLLVALGEDIHLSCDVAEYSLTLFVEDNVILGRRELIYKKSTVSPEDYPEFKTFYNKAVKADARQILMKVVKRNQ